MVIGSDPLGFGDPEGISMENFSGGEIDPITGEIIMTRKSARLEGNRFSLTQQAETQFGAAFGQGDNTVFNTVNQNPLFSGGNSEMGASQQEVDEYLETDVVRGADGASSIGSLSDFDEADFEDFADSLLAESALTDIPLDLVRQVAAKGAARQTQYLGGADTNINIGRSNLNFDFNDLNVYDAKTLNRKTVQRTTN